MRVAIIEDEHLTAERIKTLLHRIDPGIIVLTIIDSVRTAVQWFSQHENPDLVFMDIQLADGLSFDIFERIKIDYPVIFITAYQEYAIKAFKVNSVDYLLKPISEENLRAALVKYQNFFALKKAMPVVGYEVLNSIREMISKPYKSRFMIKVGEHIRSVDVKEILYFYSMQKGTYLHTAENRNYVIDYTLDALVDLVDPSQFFRISRKYIVSHTAISDLITLSGTRLKVKLVQSDDDEIYISRDRIQDFKGWLDQ